MRFIKQSTSVDLPIGPFVDSTDGFTAETALTLTQPDIRLKKNGGAWAQKAAAQTLSHEENGNYEVTLDATDTDTLGHMRLHVNETGALPVWEDFIVLPANVYDSLVNGSDKLQTDVAEWLGTAVATPTVAGVPEVDLTHVAGATTNVAALATNVDAILTDTGTTLDARIPAALVGGRMDASVGAMAANVMTAAAAAADLTTELQSGLATAAALDTVDNFLDTEVAAILVAVDTEVAAIKAVTDLLPNGGALSNLDAAISTRLPTAGYTVPPTALENADVHLKRDMSAVTGEAARSPLNALRAIRNKVSRAGATVTVTKEDDTTSAWTATITTDVAAAPITVVDPTT